MFLLHPRIAPWCVPDERGLTLVLLIGQALPPGRVFVRTLPDNEEQITPMQPDGCSAALQRWRAHVAWDRGNALTRYAFVVAHPEGQVWLAADGQHCHVPPEAQHFRVHPGEQPPAWVREQVFYQVFPDRFARSGQGPVSPHGVAADWGAPLLRQHASSTFYGGDLPGLTQQLPYLNDELGASAIYLNPVFASRSSHRYDTTDYTQVDAALGGNQALAALRQAMRERGMRLVLDAVVNHTGAHHPWVTQRPTHYARSPDGQLLGWKGHAGLPVLDFAEPAVQQAIYGAGDAVLRRWLQPPYAIDGWRLDVIHMLGEGPGAHHNAHHVRAMRRAILAENPEAYVLGEHFAEATRWLQGEQEDGAVNYYGFTQPVRGWLAGLEMAGERPRLSTAQFEQWMVQAMATIPHANQLAQLNLLDSHDTPRLLTELDGDLARMKLAVTLLFTRPGVPCVYYGDEIGLEGGADPDCRRCFDWDRNHWRRDLWAHYQGLARERRRRGEWQAGATVTLAQGADWLAYARFDRDRATVVVVNRGAPAAMTLPLNHLPFVRQTWRTLEGEAVVAHATGVTVSVPGCSSVVLMSN
jgi:alpha-glucosidase